VLTTLDPVIMPTHAAGEYHGTHPAPPVTVSVVGGQLTLTPAATFLGMFKVNISASDGLAPAVSRVPVHGDQRGASSGQNQPTKP